MNCPPVHPSFKRTLVAGAPDRPYYYDVVASSVSVVTGPVVSRSTSTSVTSNIQIKNSSTAAVSANTYEASSDDIDDIGLPFFANSYDFDSLVKPQEEIRAD